MPMVYSEDKFDLAGFSVGIIEGEDYPKKINSGDLIVGLSSTGVHSNGFSLIRHILKLKKINNKKIIKDLLKPTKIYVKEILNLNSKNLLNGCCNITGGGLVENLPRILPSNLSIQINLEKIKTNQIFKYIKKFNVSDDEMLKTFNCGVGFCIIVNKKNINKVKRYFTKNYQPYPIGYVCAAKSKKIIFNGKIKY